MPKPQLEKLFDDWAAKVLSLAAAVALFSFYQLNKLEERPLSVPLTVLTNGQFVPASQYPRTVRLVLRGESNAIYAVLERDLVATLDLRPFNAPGVFRVPVIIEKRGSALGIDPLEISVEPGELALALETRVVKQLAVLPSFRGFLEPGFELVGFSLSPPAVEAAGPASVMAGLADASTESVELSGRSGDFSLQVRLQQKDPLVEFLGSDSVEFTAEVRKAVVYKSFADLAISPQGLKVGLRLISELPLASARVAAARSELENYIPADDVFVADLSAIEEPGVHTVAVIPRFPEGMSVESWLPMVITVSVDAYLPGSTEARP
jgi:hypothetical protein